MTARLIPSATSLHTKLVVTLAVLITLVVVCFAYIQIDHERKTRINELEERAKRITDLISSSVAYSVWNVDFAAIDKQLASVSSDPEIVQITITAVGYGTLREIDHLVEPIAEPIAKTQDITFETVGSGVQKIGEVRIVLTRALVEQSIAEAHRAVWFLVIVILSVLYAVTYVLLKKMVSVPVNRLGEIVDQIALGDMDSRCPVESHDELGRLAIRVNSMADRLRESGENLRDSETRLKLVLDGSQLGYWDWNIKKDEVIRNSRWAEMLGYDLESLGSTIDEWKTLQHDEDRERVWNSINTHLEGRSSIHEIEYRMLAENGDYKWVLDQGKVVSWDAEGKPLRMCGTQKDITERKMAEVEREKLQNQLTQAQKMESVGQLAGGVAHDFNNMLSVILGYTEIAMDQVDSSSSLHGDLQEVYSAGKRSADIVGQLMTFARQQTVAPQILDLNETLETMLNMLGRLLGEDIALHWLPGEELGKVKIDPSQFDQLLANLCVNARDAIAGVGTISVETRAISFDEEYCNENAGFVPGDFTLLSVSDDGCGMEKEILLKVFEPFFTTKGVGQGTGLGLATVYGIIKQNDGFINVYSEPGQGTTFNIYLPVHSSAADAPHTLSLSEDIRGGTETILMVEDDGMVLKMGRNMLEKLGYTVQASSGPLKALQMVKASDQKIDLVITDVIMPEMNGRALAEQMYVLDSEIKVLFMSGYTADVIAHRGVLDEGVSFLHKPFTNKGLAVKVREILDQG